MESIVITLIGPDGDSVDLELPDEAPSGEMFPRVAHKLGWLGDGSAGAMSPLLFVKATGQIIRPGESLAAAGVVTGDVLVLRTEGVDASLPTQFPAARGRGPVLAAQSGETFQVGHKSIIGRPDSEQRVKVDVDLSRLDSKRRSSRPHAMIYEEAGQYFIQDQGSKLGTFVNGRLISAAELLTHGDVIQFGKGGLYLQFQNQ